MFGTKKTAYPHPHNPYVKYTKYGEPYLDVENFYKSDLAKKLNKRSKEIGKIITESTRTPKDKKSSKSPNESS